jgi:hypothetical protein
VLLYRGATVLAPDLNFQIRSIQVTACCVPLRVVCHAVALIIATDVYQGSNFQSRSLHVTAKQPKGFSWCHLQFAHDALTVVPRARRESDRAT